MLLRRTLIKRKPIESYSAYVSSKWSSMPGVLLVDSTCRSSDSNLWVAASDNNIGRVKELIEDASSDLSPNSKDGNGYTPMHAAAGWGHKELLEYLISKGGDANVTDNDGDSPLHSTEDVIIAQILVDAGADLAIKNDEGLTPNDVASEEGLLEMCNFFREKLGMDPMTAESIRIASNAMAALRIDATSVRENNEPLNEIEKNESS
ncbi:hypothetical protein SARC_04421 [Sphaeroforma arctica JP610]|uniref:Uncharacterized protein n=1 Tax=Sphaeroforma arctica JP610 TaxID=667725 RepID=A0A0L0G2L6_9EUKA|nr:hypothetical protein SARC_04421 [Sphaeroforma arctica JP610]KNC83325.1 hypothetical protein SARC_04421 [Sphaeroforma arctica JP610]|eukprot:XP_014157227.1 hypothetical protein SARC_04421 [Sphaeroforma arctica JP610]